MQLPLYVQADQQESHRAHDGEHNDDAGLALREVFSTHEMAARGFRPSDEGREGWHFCGCNWMLLGLKDSRFEKFD
jgi:hypothetical protein